jgi:hypothetical protein
VQVLGVTASNTSRIWEVSTSTTAVTNRRRRRRDAGDRTVSSKPIIVTGPTRAGSSTAAWPSLRTAVQAVDHDSPNPRAIDAGSPRPQPPDQQPIGQLDA